MDLPRWEYARWARQERLRDASEPALARSEDDFGILVVLFDRRIRVLELVPARASVQAFGLFLVPLRIRFLIFAFVFQWANQGTGPAPVLAPSEYHRRL